MNFDIKSFLSERNNIISTFLVLMVVIFIAFLLPKGARFNLEYKKGEIWKHSELLAPFEFSLLKSNEEVKKAKEETRRNFVPIFRKTQAADKIHNNISVYTNELKKTIDKGNFQKILKYLKENQNRLLISSKQLEYEGYKKSSFNIQEKDELKLYNKSQYVLIENYYESLSKLLPSEHHEELGNIIRVELEIDEKRSLEALKQAEQNAITSNVIIKNGELIVSRGNLITNTVFQKLSSLEDAFAKKKVNFIDGIGSFLGHIILTLLILGALVLYLHFHFPYILQSPKELGFILLWIVIFSFMVFQIEKAPNLSSYMIPFCIAPIIIKTYYEERLALFVHIVIVLIASFLSRLGYEFTFLQILAGIVTVLLIEETRYWDRFFLSILIIIATYFLGFLGLNMAATNELGSGIDASVFKWLGVNGVLILLAYPFIPFFSKVFGFTSSITLMELSDLNKKLLKNLSLSAPGTFQHSLQVSNLSEAAAEKIGANSLLVKVSALYHDIGKLINPMLFIENVSYGKNPHDSLSYFDSARGIINHVEEGEKMARSNSLPKEIIRMIKTHHGTTRVEFFYRNQLSDYPDQEFDHTLFQYPGPKPVTKEETILLMADSIEAASKSLKNVTRQDINDLVEKIVDKKIEYGQLSESKLTFEELVICKGVFKDVLSSINHVRVEYPEEKKQIEEDPKKVQNIL